MERRVAVALVVLAAVIAGCGGGGGDGGPVQLNFWAYNEPGGTFQAAAENCTKEAEGRYEIVFNALGNDPNTQRQQLVRRLAAGDPSIDLMSMDVIWTAEFAEAEWILPFPDDVRSRIEEGTLEGPLQTASYKDELYGAPANSNTQLLWYRKDLVQDPPTTWDALIEEAVQQKKFFEVQGSAYEGYTVWFNSLLEAAGGKVLSSPDEASLEEEPLRKALEIISKLAKSPAADPSIANIKEDQARLAFEGGDAIFQVNYPFVYASAKDAEDKSVLENMGWAPYPSVEEGKPGKPPIGGFNWGVGAHTEHPDEAFAAAECMRDERNQRAFATKGGLPPTLESLYDDKEFKKVYPFGDLIRKSLEDPAVRPATPVYADVSLTIFTALSPPAGFNVDEAADTLQQAVQDALQSKGLI
jgi:multiple sugar transport system substrate-binding protein